MQTHSLISNTERWLYLRTTERQAITDFTDFRESRPQRNLDENRKTEEEKRREKPVRRDDYSNQKICLLLQEGRSRI